MYKLLLLCFLFSGCLLPDTSGEWTKWEGNSNLIAKLPLTFSVCDFSKQDTDTIINAVYWWNDIVGKEIFTRVDCNSNANIEVTNFLDVVNGEHIADTASYPCGNYLCPGMFVSLFSMWNDYDTKHKEQIVRHEFGHVLGMGHGYRLGCLMYYGTSNNYPPIESLCSAELQMLCNHYPDFKACGE